MTSLAGRSTVGSLFSSRAISVPDHIALTDGRGLRTYRELNERTNRLATALKNQGLMPGDRIAVCLRNSIEFLELEIAAAKAGIIVAALNWRLVERELEHCVRLVQPRMIVTQKEFSKRLGSIVSAELPILLTGSAYETFLQKGGKQFEAEGFDPETGLVILYTSGTTGLPKGALISHRAMIARAGAFSADLGLPAAMDFVAWAPLYHMASTDHSIATLLGGGTVHIVDGYQPEELGRVIQQVEIGWFVLMPGMVGDFAAYCRKNGIKPKRIIACGAMADLVPRDEIAAVTRALKSPYLNTFGATETGLPPATGNTIAIGQAPAHLPKKQSSFCEVRLVDADDNDVADGEPGEVAVRGPTVFSGYWDAEETNKKDFRNGWFHMGDVLRRLPDGTLEYVDRVKYMIKSGGENIYPAEIEKVILMDPGVESATVVRQPDQKWGEVPVAFVVSRGQATNEVTLRQLCEAQLARYKIPKQFHFLRDDELPRSTTGKIQRHELEKRLTATPRR